MTAEDYFDKGNKAYENGDFKSAIENYTKAIELKPEYAMAYNNRGNLKSYLSDYRGAIEDYNKAIELMPDDAEAYNNRGNAKCNLSDYHGAIENYNKAIEIKSEYAEAYYNRGNAKSDLSDYHGAIEDYDKAIEIKPEYANAYNNRGIAKSDLSDDCGVIEDYNKAIELMPDDAEAYNNRGNAKCNLSDYHGAIEDYDKAIELKPDDAEAYYNRGTAKSDLSDYHGAIEDYDKAIRINSDYADAYNNRGTAKYNLSDYRGATEDYDKAIELKPDYALAYNNRGLAKYNLSDYRGAIEDYDKAIEINPEDVNVRYNRGLALAKISEKLDEVAEVFIQNGINILDILTEEHGKEIAKMMLTHKDYQDDFFKKEVIEKCEEKDIEGYKEIFIESLEIIIKLQVDKDNQDGIEMSVSHYTKKEVAERLLFDDYFKDKDGALLKRSGFRLNSVNTSNDPEEGKTLFHYLFPQEKLSPQVEEFGAFAGCFILNKDSLNQFRLYGKTTDNIEGTGVSIVLNEHFFSEKIYMPVKSSSTKEEKEKEKEEEKTSKSLPLFRCIYIDPETNRIVSLGQKDEYVFYREHKEKAEESKEKVDYDKVKTIYREYKTNIDRIQNEICIKLEKLKQQAVNLNRNIVYNLLLNLRYLVKHAAFKEEQECRVIQIEKLYDNNKDKSDENKVKSDENNRLYVQYLKLDETNVSEICFAPKAKDIDKFKQHLARNNYIGVKCYKSEAPLA